ncbi:hypothetical protein CCYA_CCYA16G4094 [Cyanidiococcus yangmingshanensis]|nr:hypothetical protein CCYA_CCYA16G4094 [Cyanidiococcus yangmingshanensis]
MVKFMDLPSLSALNADLTQVPLPPSGHTLLTCTLEAYSCKATTADKRVAHSLESRLNELLSDEATLLGRTGARTLLDVPHRRKVLIYLILVLNASFPEYDFSGIVSRAPACFESRPPSTVQHDADLALQEAYRYVDEEHDSIRRAGVQSSVSASVEDHWRPRIGRAFRKRVQGIARQDGHCQASSGSRTLAIASSHRRKRALETHRPVVSAPCTKMGPTGASCLSVSYGTPPSERLTSLLGTRERLWSIVHQVIGYPSCEVYTFNEAEDTGGPFHEPGIIWSFNYFFYNHALKRVLFMRATATQTSCAEMPSIRALAESESLVLSDSATEDESTLDGVNVPQRNLARFQSIVSSERSPQQRRGEAPLIFELNP